MNDAAPPATASDSLEQEAALPDVIGLGASAGGLNALRAFLSNVPESLDTPIVVVQHMARDHESMLVDLLSRATSRRVLRAEDGLALEPRTVYVQIPGALTRIEEGRLLVTDSPHVRGVFDYPIDGFFESLAAATGAHGVAVVLSGTGTDGSRGIRRVREEGGLVLAQSPSDAEFDGMCQAAIDSGVVDRVDTAPRLAAIAAQFLEFGRPLDDRSLAPVPLEQMGPIDRVVALLSRDGGIDFSVYKPAAIYRRIERRAVIRQCEDVAAYVSLLRDDPDEVADLAREMLINVTRFFRDAEVWGYVEDVLLPRLLRGKEDGDVVRAWVAGCATGEEAYSMAMLLVEAIAKSGKQLTPKVFATDVAPVVEPAAVGEYPEAAVADIPPDRRSRFFDETPSGSGSPRSCATWSSSRVTT